MRVAILAVGNSRAVDRAISTPPPSNGCAIQLYLRSRHEIASGVSGVRIFSSEAEGKSLDALLLCRRVMVDPDLNTELPHLKGADFLSSSFVLAVQRVGPSDENAEAGGSICDHR